VSVLDLGVLRAPPSVSPDSVPPLPYTEGPLAGILVDPSGVHCDEDDDLYLSSCLPCRSALPRGKVPRFALSNLNIIG